MNYSPKVSIIIPNFNGVEFLRVCLLSLKIQTYKDFDITVIDNNSTDNSINYIRNNYPEVCVIKNKKNFGYAVAVNQGIKSSNSEFVATLNNDTEVDSNWLGNIMIAFNNNPEISFCASKILNYFSRNIIESAGDELVSNGFGRKIGYGNVNNGEYQASKYVFSACGAAAVYKKKMLDDIGFFDEKFFAYLEDIDLSFRAHLMGYKCLFVPDAVVYHREFGTSNGDKLFPITNSLRNSIMLVIKNYPASLLISKGMFLNIIFAYVRTIVFLTIKGRFKNIVETFCYIICNFRILLKDRRKNLKNRTVSYQDLKSMISKEEITFTKVKSFLVKFF